MLSTNLPPIYMYSRVDDVNLCREMISHVWIHETNKVDLGVILGPISACHF